MPRPVGYAAENSRSVRRHDRQHRERAAPVDKTAGVSGHVPAGRPLESGRGAAGRGQLGFAAAATLFASGDGGARAAARRWRTPPTRRARRPPLAASARAVDSFVSACAFIPYALVALALRLVMARVFFLDGQTRIDGPRVPLNVHGLRFLGGAAAAREGGNLHRLPHPICRGAVAAGAPRPIC